MKITISGNIASKKNSKRMVWAGKKLIPIPSKAYMKWLQMVRKHFRENDYGEPTEDDVHVSAKIYYRGPTRDLSGSLESIGDAFEKFLWINDKQIKSWDGSRLYRDKADPRVELTITRVKETDK